MTSRKITEMIRACKHGNGGIPGEGRRRRQKKEKMLLPSSESRSQPCNGDEPGLREQPNTIITIVQPRLSSLPCPSIDPQTAEMLIRLQRTIAIPAAQDMISLPIASNLPGPSASSQSAVPLLQRTSPAAFLNAMPASQEPETSLLAVPSYNDQLFLFWRHEHEFLMQKLKKLEAHLERQELNQTLPQDVLESGSAYMIQQWQAFSCGRQVHVCIREPKGLGVAVARIMMLNNPMEVFGVRIELRGWKSYAVRRNLWDWRPSPEEYESREVRKSPTPLRMFVCCTVQPSSGCLPR